MARGKRQLGTTAVSSQLHSLIKGIESDAMAVEAATYYKQRDEAYGKLSVTRASLYAYVAELERQLGVSQTVKLRF